MGQVPPSNVLLTISPPPTYPRTKWETPTITLPWISYSPQIGELRNTVLCVTEGPRVLAGEGSDSYWAAE